MMKYWLFLLNVVLSLLVISITLSACGILESSPPEPTKPPTPIEQQQPTEEPQETPTPEGPKPAAIQKVVFAWAKEFENLNPIYSNKWESTFTQQIWNCWAWDFDNNNSPRAVLVQEIPSLSNGGISEDGKTITMRLRDGIVWSDGTPISATDFLFTYEMQIAPNNTVLDRHPYDLIERIETIDAQTIQIAFREPYAPWLTTLWHGLLPEHILRPVFQTAGTLNNADWNRAPTVGCGPFVFTEWQPGVSARFTRNDRYWGNKPVLEEITLRFIPDENSLVDALKSNSAQLGTPLSYGSAQGLVAAGIQISGVFSGYNEGWFFNLDETAGNSAIQDQRVRQAISLALNREQMIQTLLFGQTKPAIGYWDNTPYVDPGLQPWPYDPERARQLLDEAGWIDSNGDGVRDKDEEELILIFGTTDSNLRVEAANLAAQQLAEIGIRLDIFTYSMDEFFKGYSDGGPVATGLFDIFEYATGSNFPDPNTADFLCEQIPSPEIPTGLNWNNVCDLELNDLFKLQATQIDFQARQQTFHIISRMIFEQVYFMGLWQDPDLWGLSVKLMNVQLSGVTPFYNIGEWVLLE
jgi:peptide/nickel transport system substrate-binding protein